jgi:hypothetical protein
VTNLALTGWGCYRCTISRLGEENSYSWSQSTSTIEDGKNKFFFVSEQWEFAPSKHAKGPQVPRETNMLSERGNKQPTLTKGELARVIDVLKWGRLHEVCTYYGVLVSVPRLMEFVYAPAAHVSVKLTEEVTRVPVNPSPPAANTRGATPRKDQA